jgi:D-beta-D-heptose 7-phosphate kinase / D-beta-D-heptose 1-phosphate adenosyltransferase
MTKQLDHVNLGKYYTQSFDSYKHICNAIKNNCEGKIIFTNGCFDILHVGHANTLNYCRHLSGYKGIVVVGLNSDDSIKRLKGSNRPINTACDRAALLLNLASVDYVIEFDEDTPEVLIKELMPSVVVKGGDYKQSKIVGSEYVPVTTAPFIDGYSTSNTIKNIKENNE